MMNFDDMPGAHGAKPPTLKGVLHARLVVGDIDIIASDVRTERFQPMRSAYLSLNVDSDAEAEHIFQVLSDGGEIFMPMGEQFFATRFAQLRDKFGTLWMIVREKPMGPPQA